MSDLPVEAMLELSRGAVLYGPMGSGKSTLGQKLADVCGFDFVDTDRLIEAHFNMEAGDIVRDPEMDFAECQRIAIASLVRVEPIVVATGGSVAMYEDLVQHLAQFGRGIHLDVPASELMFRLSAERISGLNNPLGLSFEDLMSSRRKWYSAATQARVCVELREDEDETFRKLLKARMK